jgi:gamma-glutamyltranspeptidase/glutathione hydrolase
MFAVVQRVPGVVADAWRMDGGNRNAIDLARWRLYVLRISIRKSRALRSGLRSFAGGVLMVRHLVVAGLWSVLVLTQARAQEAAAPAVDGSLAGLTEWQVEGTEGAVAAGGREAVAAGVEILKQGGNAADAAAATIFALGITDWRSFCFGGEVPILIYDAKVRAVTVIAGQGTAPRLATLEHFRGPGGIPSRGIEAAAVPAALDACLTLLDRFGTMTFAQVIAPTRELLRKPARVALWHADLARTLETLVAAESVAHPASATGPGGDRRRGLRLVADAFYRGPIARRIDAWSTAHGGLIRYVDLATHTTRVEDPVSIEYHGLTIAKCGPWTQGPFLLEALQILDGMDLKAMGHNRPAAVHTIVETMKLALADRDTFYADPLFAAVPMAALLAPRYAARRRGLIDPVHASLVRRPGDPRGGRAILDPDKDPVNRHLAPPLAAAHDTTTCVVADRFGNVVAATPSGWSGVVAGDTGVWLGSRLQSFNVWPEHPHVIVPGKRPRITLSPTLVLREGKPVLAISVAGGDNQDQMTLQLLLNHFEFGLEPAKSVVAPRFMTDHLVNSFRQTPPALGKLRINPEIGTETIEALKTRGHLLDVSAGPLAAAPSVIAIDPVSRKLRAAGDPRAGRHALGY